MLLRGNVSHSLVMETEWSGADQPPYSPDALAPGYADCLYAVMRQVPCFTLRRRTNLIAWHEYYVIIANMNDHHNLY